MAVDINKLNTARTRTDRNFDKSKLLSGVELIEIFQDIEKVANDGGGGASSLYEEILFANFQTASAAGTLTPGKTYAITNLLSGTGTFRLLLQGFNRATNNGVANGTLIYTNFITDYSGVWEVQFNIGNGSFVSFYNRAYNVQCNTEAMFLAFFAGNVGGAFLNSKITDCNFNNYTGTLTLDGNYTTLKNCDFSNSSANFTTTNLTTPATFSGRILHNFTVPNQGVYPCDFTNTIEINADRTNNMEATITLAAAQTDLDYTGFQSAGIVRLVPDAGGNSITGISNVPANHEFKIVSSDTAGLLSIDTGTFININVVTNSVVLGQILWSGTHVARNEIYFYRRGTDSYILAKSNIYS